MGVSAHNGCYSCIYCNFNFLALPSNPHMRDFSNLDIDSYPRRTKETHSINSEAWKRCKTQTDRDASKSKTGTSYSAFQQLSYFECIDFASIDILHCLYLGIYLKTIYSMLNLPYRRLTIKKLYRYL